MTNAPMDDLLDQISDDKGGDTKPVDLLNEIDDSGAPAWVPDKDGEGVQGVVLHVGSQPDDYNPDDTVPVVTLKTADGEVRVIGFATVLRKEIREKAPQIGDTFAVKFIGSQTLKKGKFAGKPVKIYRAAIAEAPQNAGQSAATPF